MTDFNLLQRIDFIRCNIGLEPLRLNLEGEGDDDLNRYLHEVDTSGNCSTFKGEELDAAKTELRQMHRLMEEREETIELLQRKLKEQRGSFDEQLRQVNERYQSALAHMKEKYEGLVEFYEDKLRSGDRRSPDKSDSKETALLREIDRLNREAGYVREEKDKSIEELRQQLQERTEELDLIKTAHEEQISTYKEKCSSWKSTALKLKEGLTKASMENVGFT
jgi:chromosome segregation ATPase